jgi:hypothetical protein
MTTTAFALRVGNAHMQVHTATRYQAREGENFMFVGDRLTPVCTRKAQTDLRETTHCAQDDTCADIFLLGQAL